LLAAYCRFLAAHARLVVGAALLCALLAVWVSYQRLHYSSDRTDMLAPDQPVQLGWRNFRAEFGSTMDYVVLVRGSTAEAQLAVEALAGRLRSQPKYFEQILYRLDLPHLATSALYYLSLADLRALLQELRTASPWLEALAHRQAAADSLKAYLGQTDKSKIARQLRPALPLLTRLLEGLVVSLESRGEAAYRSPFDQFQPPLALLQGGDFVPGQTRFYTTLDGGQTFMLLVRAHAQESNYRSDVDSLERLRTEVATVRARHAEVQFMVSGEPVINTDEMVGALKDALRSGALAILLVTLLLVTAFGGWLRAGAVMLSLLVALSWSCAFAAWAVGSLNLLTVNFATILVGLGMTFGIHILYRFQQNRASNVPLQQSLRETLAQSGRDNLIGAFTTAVAFWALYFTSFRAAGELGLITGTGVVFCFLSMVTVLPSLLVLMDGGRSSRDPFPDLGWMARIDERIRSRPLWVLTASLLVSLYCASWTNRIEFDYDVLNMQPADSSAVKVEHYLQSAGYSALFAVSISQDLGQARRQTERFAALPSVARVESVAMFEPQQVAAKQPVVQNIVRAARLMRSPGVIPRRLTAWQLLTLYENFQWMERAVRGVLPHFASQDRPMAHQIGLLLNRLDASLSITSPGPAESGVILFVDQFTGDLESRLHFLHSQQANAPKGLEQLPQELRSRSISSRGRLVVRVFPKYDCWQREHLEQFVRQLRRVDPQVTGTPILILQYLQELRQAFSLSARNALVVIVVLLLLHFRSLRRTALAICPKLLGLLWMVGLMGFLGESFNPANSMALPLTLGIGLVFGVQVLQHYLDPDTGSLFDDSTGPAIVVSSLASVLGFATLLIAEHRGVASFGFVMTAGVVSTLVASTVTLPALVGLLRRSGVRL